MKRSICFILAVLFFPLYASFASASTSSNKTELGVRCAEAYGKLPLSFVENKGQLNKAVRYVINGSRASAFFTDTGVTFDLVEELTHKTNPPKNPSVKIDKISEKPVKHVALKMEFAGASPKCRVTGVEKLPGKMNIIKGKDSRKWKTDIPAYRRIIYKDAWKGIDVSYSGNRKQIKYDIIINPGANVSDIKLRYKGADKIWLDKKGDLHIKTAVASFTETVPGIHQIKSGRQTSLKGGYVLLNKQTVGFKVQGADPRLPIVIDPASDLVYSTFIGGSGDDEVYDIAVDNEGCVYIVGCTVSSDFPVTPGSFDITFDTTYQNTKDAFVTKLNESGSAIVYSTLIGGVGDDIAYGIAVDNEGYAFICGSTASAQYDTFPVTLGAFNTMAWYTDAFVTKLNPSGSGLVYSSYFGSSEIDMAYDIDLDDTGSAYVTGCTDMLGQTMFFEFPITPDAFDKTHNGKYDIFVSKFDPSGSYLDYSTYIGCSSWEKHSIAVDAQGCAYIAGGTSDISFPVTSGAFDVSFNGGNRDAFVTKLDRYGTELLYSTFLGGADIDFAYDIAVDDQLCAYIVGSTKSTDYPTTQGAFDTSHNGNNDAFITKLNQSGSQQVYSTLLGGPGDDTATGVVVDNEGNAYISGSPLGGYQFPTTPGALYRIYDTFKCSYVAKLNTTGSLLEYSTLFGDCLCFYNRYIALDSEGSVYFAGSCVSQDFITTPNAFDSSYNGGYSDAFITKLSFKDLIVSTDLLLKAGNSSYDGNNIYSADGSSQVKSQNAYANQTVNYAFRVQNDGNAVDSYNITGTAGGDGWTVKYCDFNTNADVTTQITGEGWNSGMLAPGATNGVYALITPNNTVAVGSTKTLVISAVSQSDSSKIDTGKAVTTAAATYKTDILVKSGTETSYSFNNIYSTDGSSQAKTQNASMNQTVSYGFRVQNDGNTNDTFKITGSAGGSGWTVKYYDLTTNADVTSQVTGTGWSSGVLAPGATNGVYVKVTPGSDAASGSVNTLLITATSQGNTSSKDVCKTLTTAVATCKTDILMKAGTEMSYSFNNIYGTDGSNQIKSLSASVNQRVNYGFRVQNDGNTADTFKITGPAGGSGWTVVYKDLTTNADVTSQVTGSGWTSGSLAPGSTGGVYVLITPDDTVASGSENVLTITAVSQSDMTKIDVCKAVSCRQ